MKVFENQLRLRTSKIFLITSLAVVVIGMLNLFLNYNKVITQVGDYQSYKFWFTLLAIIPTSLIVEAFYILVLSIVSYFVAAAMGTGFEIKKFINLSVRSLIGIPLIGISDTIGFITFESKLTDLGILGMISYIPFYIITFMSMYIFSQKLIRINKKKALVISVVAILTLIPASYPFK